MAPNPRKSSVASPRKEGRQRHGSRDDNWEMLRSPRSPPGGDANMMDPADIAALYSPSYLDEDALQPLRNMADRVGHEVESFAVMVDSFINRNREAGSNKMASALTFCSDLHQIAEKTVGELTRRHQHEDRDSLRKTIRRRARGEAPAQKPVKSDTLDDLAAADASTVDDLREWQQEANTWALLQTTLEISHNANDRDRIDHTKARLRELGAPTKQMPDEELWEHFLLSSSGVLEKEKILQWLEGSIVGFEDDVKDIMEQLEEEAGGTDASLWSQGWLHTREKIKSQKRIRVWESPLGTDVPTIRNTENTESLVTQLDPDAPTRQKRGLEKQDRFYERSVWLTIWEMLRRGKPWSEIREWCNDKNESWRAVSLGIAADEFPGARTRVQDIRSGAMWRAVCYAASQKEGEDDYQRAIYGLLGGNAAAMEPVCRSCDDFLFAHFQAAILQDFDRYLNEQFPGELALNVGSKSGPLAFGRQRRPDSLTRSELSSDSVTKWMSEAEAQSPMKQIQMALLIGQLNSLIRSVALGLMEKDGPRYDEFAKHNATIDTLVKDSNAIRVLAHICIIRKTTGSGLGIDGHDADRACEEIIKGHVQSLWSAGKMDAIPTYIAMMSHDGGAKTLGEILPDVVELNDQKMLLRLMEEYNLDVTKILHGTFRTALLRGNLLQENADGSVHIPIKDRIALTEPAEEGLWPGIRLASGFMSRLPNEDENNVIQALEWWKLVPGKWCETFMELYQPLNLLVQLGRLSAAYELCTRLPYIDLSMMKTQSIVGQPLDIFEEDELAEEQEFTIDVWEPSTPSQSNGVSGGSGSENGTLGNVSNGDGRHGKKTEKLSVHDMRTTCLPFLHLQQLMAAIDLVRECRELFETTPFTAANASRLHSVVLELIERMEPILWEFCDIEQPDPFLIKNDGMAAALTQLNDFRRLRLLFLPEMILAHLTILHRASFTLHTHDFLMAAMELATAIAGPDNPKLKDCFVQTGRVGELVQVLGAASQALLTLQPRKPDAREGGNVDVQALRGRGRDWGGETAWVWDVTAQHLN